MREGWKLTPIGELASTSSGATPKAGDLRYYDDGAVPFLKIGDLTNGLVKQAETHITDQAVRDCRLRLHPPGTVLVAMYGSVGKTGMLGFPATTNQAILALAVDASQVDADYLHYALLGAQGELAALARGATQKNINKQIVEDFRIPLPPIEEQRRIVDLLRAIDAAWLAALREAASASALAARLRSRFLGDADLRNVPLRDAVTVTMGRQRSPKHQVGDHIVPYLRAANVKDGHLALDDVLSMNFTPAEQDKFALQQGDVLVTEGCGSLAQIGANAVWEKPIDDTVCFQNTLLRLRAVAGKTLPSFVAHWARFAFESGAFSTVASGTSIFHIGAERAAVMPFPLPLLERQRDIARVLDEGQNVAEAARARVDAFQSLRAAALSSLLSGAHEIPDSYDHFLDENLPEPDLELVTV